MTPVQTWLSERFRGIPDALRTRLEHVLTHTDHEGDPAEVLARLARTTIGELKGDESREDAMTLLAADALMTYACEAAAEADPDSLGYMV